MSNDIFPKFPHPREFSLGDEQPGLRKMAGRIIKFYVEGFAVPYAPIIEQRHLRLVDPDNFGYEDWSEKQPPHKTA